ncbi:MAG: dual specificity protein phosphatase family protein [Candidatus Latescibacteria bacterium]|nr:dual specificity protein phosphatase family protein [Candidatus Latescibacterota bacterium]
MGGRRRNLAVTMRNFSWLIEGVIAGMGRPGGYGSDGQAQLQTDLRQLREHGIVGIVSLTEAPIHWGTVERLGFDYLHIPIADMGTPTMEAIDRFIEFVERIREQKKGVVVHCVAGIGRTGMMLACYLVSQGKSTTRAIETVRAKRPGSMETADQELAVFDYEQHCKTKNYRGHEDRREDP